MEQAMKQSHHKPGELRHARPPRLLRDMRAVYRQPKEEDRGPGQANCRWFLEEDRSAFMAKMAQLEAAHRLACVREAEKKREACAGQIVARNEVDERALEVVEQWLREHGTTDEPSSGGPGSRTASGSEGSRCAPVAYGAILRGLGSSS
jgi:hypothetical protein